MASNTNPRFISGNHILLFCGIAFAEASHSMTMVQIPVFLRELGAEIDEIGFFFTVALIFPLLLRIVGGWISDRIGRVRAMWLGSLAGILTYIPYTLVTSWELALIAPALLAVATSLIAPSYRAHIADTTDRQYLGRVFGIAETVRNFAWIVAPPLGGILAHNLDYRWLFMAAIFSYIIASLIFLSMTRVITTTRSRAAQPVGYKSLLTSLREVWLLAISGGLVTWLLIADGVHDIASKLSFDLMPVYLSDIAGLSKQSIGFLDGLHGVAMVATGILGGWIVDKTSERFSIVTGFSILVFSRVMFAIAVSFWGFGFSWILLGVGGAVIQPALSSLVSKGVPSHLMAITFGFLTTSLGVISLPFPWIGSQLWNALGPKAPFLITVVIGTLAIPPAWYKLIPPKESSASS